MIIIVTQEKQGILAGDSLNSTNSGAATYICVCVDIYVGSVCRTGVQNFYFVTFYQNVRY